MSKLQIYQDQILCTDNLYQVKQCAEYIIDSVFFQLKLCELSGSVEMDINDLEHYGPRPSGTTSRILEL